MRNQRRGEPVNEQGTEAFAVSRDGSNAIRRKAQALPAVANIDPGGIKRARGPETQVATSRRSM
jgi:hypothetical protein